MTTWIFIHQFSLIVLMYIQLNYWCLRKIRLSFILKKNKNRIVKKWYKLKKKIIIKLRWNEFDINRFILIYNWKHFIDTFFNDRCIYYSLLYIICKSNYIWDRYVNFIYFYFSSKTSYGSEFWKWTWIHKILLRCIIQC